MALGLPGENQAAIPDVNNFDGTETVIDGESFSPAPGSPSPARINLPPIVGELLAEVLLGPSLLGWVFPTLQAHIFPKSQAQSDLLSVVSWLGVLFLLIVTGLETDFTLILRKEKTALLISLEGIVVPPVTDYPKPL